MQTERGLDRLTYFTDAIAAIAITLLILPVVDRVGDAADAGSAADFLLENLTSLLAFVLSFAIIARLWVSHHSIFEHVIAYNGTLRWLSIGWAFTIALLPLPTAMIATWSTNPLLVAFYIGTMTASSALTTAMTLVIRRTPGLESPTSPIDAARVRSSLLTTAEFVLALLVGTLVPAVGFFALFALFLSIPIERIYRARHRG